MQFINKKTFISKLRMSCFLYKEAFLFNKNVNFPTQPNFFIQIKYYLLELPLIYLVNQKYKVLLSFA